MASGGSGVKGDALAQYGTNTGEAASAYNTLSPIYTQMATNPQGFTPQQKANMLTASAQSLGGGVASAVGEGNLEAARTGNIGGYDVALDDAARNAARVQSGNALQVQNQDAQLADEHQREGLAGLDSLYGTSTGAGANYLQLANNAKPTFWQNMANEAGSMAIKNMMTAGAS